MALKIIGSGFGRTGTMSTKLALEQLGFGPCHHMVEVMGNPGKPARWRAIAAGENMDWADVFDGYTSHVDWPGAAVRRETSTAFPDAKIVHTERPEEQCWNSFRVTVGKFFTHAPTMSLPPHIAEIFRTMDRLLAKGVLRDHTDHDKVVAKYRENNQRVRDTIPADRLLVFSAADGWGPLCHFLEVPVPDAPFPRTNPRDEFWAHFGGEPV